MVEGREARGGAWAKGVRGRWRKMAAIGETEE